MGKRKSSKKPQEKKTRPKLETAFDCPFCNADKSVTCEMDIQNKVGQVRCTICGEHWQSKIHELSEPVDVYSDWIDELEEANK